MSRLQVGLTDPMRTALREAPEMPDSLLARVNGARKDGDQWVMTLSEDEAMAMTELCQWSIRKDPTTGQLNDKARMFQSIVDAIDKAG